jgi:catechol 2,3-dioxygenase-like lactoylglutathione lyase family enzyme
MTMLHHVSIGVADVQRAARFYDATLKALGFKRIMEVMPYGCLRRNDAGSATAARWR